MQTQIHKESLFMTLGIMPVPERWYKPVNEAIQELIRNSEKNRREYQLYRNELAQPVQEKKCMACGGAYYKKKTHGHKQWIGKKFCSSSCSGRYQIRNKK